MMKAKRTYYGITVAVLLLTVLLFQAWPPFRGVVAGVVRPALEAVQTGTQAMHGLAGYLPVGESKRRRLRELEEEAAELRLRVERQEVLFEQNRRLRRLMRLQLPEAWLKHRAEIIVRDPMTWDRRFRISKGSADGIRVGAAVLQGHNVIGRVVSVSGRTAMVATLADKQCRLSVRLKNTGAVGILAGRSHRQQGGRPICRITYLQKDKTYDSGDDVETSGLSDVVPGGIPVGRVVMWNSQRTAVVQQNVYAEVLFVPAASFDDLRFVTVVSKPVLAVETPAGDN